MRTVLNIAGPDLDALVAEKVFGHKVVGMASAWDPSGSGWSILRPDERDGELRPVRVDHCMCDLMPSWQEAPPGEEHREAWERIAADERASFDADRAVWGHSSSCLEVVPWYSTDIKAAWEVAQVAAEQDPDFVYRLLDMYPVKYMEDLRDLMAFQAFLRDKNAPLAICRAALTGGHE